MTAPRLDDLPLDARTVGPLGAVATVEGWLHAAMWDPEHVAGLAAIAADRVGAVVDRVLGRGGDEADLARLLLSVVLGARPSGSEHDPVYDAAVRLVGEVLADLLREARGGRP